MAQQTNEVQNNTIIFDISLDIQDWIDESCKIVNPGSSQFSSTLTVTKLPTISESWNWEGSIGSSGDIPEGLDIHNSPISIDLETMRSSTHRLIEMPVEMYFECIQFQTLWSLYPNFLLIETANNWVEKFVDSIFAANLYKEFGVSTTWYKIAAVYGLESSLGTGWINITDQPSSQDYEELNKAAFNEVFLISTFRGDLRSDYEQNGTKKQPNIKINNVLQIEYVNGWLNGVILSVDIDGSLDSKEIDKKFSWSIVRRNGDFSTQEVSGRLDWFLIFVLNNLVVVIIILIVVLILIFVTIIKLSKKVRNKPKYMICNNCEQRTEISRLYCVQCGKEIHPNKNNPSSEE